MFDLKFTHHVLISLKGIILKAKASAMCEYHKISATFT